MGIIGKFRLRNRIILILSNELFFTLGSLLKIIFIIFSMQRAKCHSAWKAELFLTSKSAPLQVTVMHTARVMAG